MSAIAKIGAVGGGIVRWQASGHCLAAAALYTGWRVVKLGEALFVRSQLSVKAHVEH